MADRFEREIEEILARLEGEDAPRPAERGNVVSIASRRRKSPGPVARVRALASRALDRLSPTAMLFTGAGIMVLGLIVSASWEPAIWASFAGVCLFIGAFLSSFVRRKPAARGPAQGAGGAKYWRDRYIEYTPQSPTPFGRIKRRFRKR